MNDQDRAELARLKSRQARLEEELSQLSAHLQGFEARLTRAGEQQQPPPTVVPKAPEATPAPVQPAADRPVTVARTAPPAPQPSPGPSLAVPPIIQAACEKVGQPVIPARPALPALSTATERAGEAPALPKPRSFELQLGTYWLVRVGIVMVLTGLVFFGNLAYHNYISRLGPGGKLTLLYMASALLLGAGWWWQRQAVKESLRNYAQVLFSGGWAALYFTTYAAHHVSPLRVLDSALLDGVLLLVCAGWMVWMADRKKSELMAMFAVGLAYYTSIITRVGFFTLYSNLLLTAAAICFLVRNRWAVLTFGSLVASYAAYGFWRFFDGESWHWASPAEGLWSGTYFLIAYWAIFTSGVFLSRSEKFAGEKRATFVTLNNGAFFTMFLLTMLQVREGGFWKFALIYGGTLLVLAELARRTLRAEPLASNSYLTQGLLLVTVGFISKFAGLQLALILAAESVVLLLMSERRDSNILRAGAYLAAGLAVGWGIDGMREHDQPGLLLAMGLGALMLVNCLIVHRRPSSQNPPLLRAQPSYFAALAMVAWLVATWNNTARENFAVVIAGEALLLTLSIYVLGVPELSLFAQGYLVLGQAAWVANWLGSSRAQPWWNPALMIFISLGLSHWWQKQKALSFSERMSWAWQLVYGLAIVGLLYCWWSPKVDAQEWLVLSAGLALAVTAYGVLTRAWCVAACGQLFVAVSVGQFVLQLAQSKPGWGFALAPMGALGVLSWTTMDWFGRRPGADPQIREPLLQIAMIYRWVALFMSLAWVCTYIPERERIWVLMGVGLGVFLLAGRKRSREVLLFSAPFTATALALFWLPFLETPKVYWPNLVALLALLGQCQVARSFQERYPMQPEIRAGAIVTGGLSVWLFVSRLVLEQASGFYLTASWSLLALALFTCGILLRERIYRWIGLGILACTVGRVVVVDVWKLETAYRVLSFMALGIVLLVLGFIYNKYQEKIREWL